MLEENKKYRNKRKMLLSMQLEFSIILIESLIKPFTKKIQKIFNETEII